MKKGTKNILIFLIILFLVVIIFFEIYLNVDYFNSLITVYIQRFGYFGILVFSFLADLLEQPIGPEVPASFGLVFGLNFWLIIIFAAVGSWIASSVNFYFGKKYFHYRLKDIKNVRRKHYRLFKKYGGIALALAAISPIPWVAFCWLAGGFRLKLRQFIFWGLIPRLMRIGFVVGVVWYARLFV